MRYYRKKEISEKFQLLKETHQYIKAIMCQNQDIVPVLADCQTLAIEIGGEIEEYQGEGCQTVALLEKYCEALYHIAQRKYPGLPEKMAESTEKELEESLDPAWESFQKDIPEERVIVFFPYMASMWDSMESVWKMLKGEEHTRCVVVPLPFYVKNGKEKAEFRYEGEKFPKELEIVSYEELLQGDFYADIAIYHNPYDDVNKLTQIDERFFSSQLHNYANTLVYMPYYVLTGEPDVSFIVLPGVKNADYVVLQDEKMVETFRYWHPKEAKKFLAFESPKITKVKEMNALPKEKLSIPDEWKEKIRGKKVLFYNTHLAGLMNEELDFIGKLKSVFDTMRKQENVILWWRPHPLTETVRFQISSERYQEYENLIRWYQQEDFGIYDDTPNLHEAIAAADGFYGDQSSVVKLFQAAGKPVMVQCFREFMEDEIVFEDACLMQGKLWCSCSLYNGLFCMDEQEKEIQYVAAIPEEEPGALQLYSKIYYWKQQLILLPYRAKQLAVFHPDTMEFEKHTISPEGENGYYTAEIYKDKMLLIPSYTRDFYILDLNSFTPKRLSELSEAVVGQKLDFIHFVVAMQSCTVGDKTYFVLQRTNLLCEFHWKDETFCFIELPEGRVYTEIQAVGNELWIMSLDTPCVVSYHIEKRRYELYSYEDLDLAKEWEEDFQQGIWAFFWTRDNSLIFDAREKEERLVFDLIEKKWHREVLDKPEIIQRNTSTLLETQGGRTGLAKLFGPKEEAEKNIRKGRLERIMWENTLLSLDFYFRML